MALFAGKNHVTHDHEARKIATFDMEATMGGYEARKSEKIRTGDQPLLTVSALPAQFLDDGSVGNI